jgi:hypothetical protein
MAARGIDVARLLRRLGVCRRLFQAIGVPERAARGAREG